MTPLKYLSLTLPQVGTGDTGYFFSRFDLDLFLDDKNFSIRSRFDLLGFKIFRFDLDSIFERSKNFDSISIRSLRVQKLSIRSRFDLSVFKKSRFDLDSIFEGSKNLDSISIRSFGFQNISIRSRFDLCAIKNFRFDLDSIRSFDLSIRSYNITGFYWLGTEDS